MMKKFFLILFIIANLLLNAQIGTSLPSTKVGGEDSKWTFGGYAGLGGSFGNGGGTSLFISPRVGYKVSENFETGLASNFSWSSSKYYSTSMLGIGPFANYYFARTAYASGLFQQYFANVKDKTINEKYNKSESALYLGGGYMQKLGERTYMQIGAMYNVLYDRNNSFLGSAFIPNVGIVYGL